LPATRDDRWFAVKLTDTKELTSDILPNYNFRENNLQTQFLVISGQFSACRTGSGT